MCSFFLRWGIPLFHPNFSPWNQHPVTAGLGKRPPLNYQVVPPILQHHVHLVKAVCDRQLIKHGSFTRGTDTWRETHLKLINPSVPSTRRTLLVGSVMAVTNFNQSSLNTKSGRSWGPPNLNPVSKFRFAHVTLTDAFNVRFTSIKSTRSMRACVG